MPAALETPEARPEEARQEAALSLREIRLAHGLTRQQVADRVADILHERGRTGESIANIERRGSRDYLVLSALAEVYDIPLGRIADIARPTGRK